MSPKQEKVHYVCISQMHAFTLHPVVSFSVGNRHTVQEMASLELITLDLASCAQGLTEICG